MIWGELVRRIPSRITSHKTWLMTRIRVASQQPYSTIPILYCARFEVAYNMPGLYANITDSVYCINKRYTCWELTRLLGVCVNCSLNQLIIQYRVPKISNSDTYCDNFVNCCLILMKFVKRAVDYFKYNSSISVSSARGKSIYFFDVRILPFTHQLPAPGSRSLSNLYYN